ncbi:MAG: hypothetical protein GX362_02345 [Methanosarcinaceae archaeon]|nr:hypothetical protein [Methanosarcinaceae archaeon]
MSTKYIKIITSFLIISLLIISSGCLDLNEENSNKSNVSDSETIANVTAQKTFLTFPEAINLSDCIVVAEYLSYNTSNEYYTEYKFKIKDVLRGEVSENEIYLFEVKGKNIVDNINYVYETGNNQHDYKVGNDYVLILEKTDSLFYDKTRYRSVTDIFIPLNDIGKSTMYGKQISEIAVKGKKEFKDYINTFKNTSTKDTKDTKKPYTESNDLKEIINESDLVLKVKITGLMVEGTLHNGNTYYCNVINVLKEDDFKNLKENDNIRVTLMKGSVNVGEEYIVILNRINKKSLIFTQSSKRSVISLNDTNTVNLVMGYI